MLKVFEWLKKELLTENVLFRAREVRRRTRGHGTLREAFYNGALGGIVTPTREASSSVPHETSNERERVLYKIFLGDNEALAYYMTFLINLPETYIEKIRARLSSQQDNGSRELQEFWSTEQEREAAETSARLHTIDAGAYSLAGVAGIKAKIKFQKTQAGGMKPWHLFLFIAESKFNFIKWGEYWATRSELGLRRLFQRGLNRKKSELVPGETETIKQIHLKSGGVLRNQLYYIFLLALRSVLFCISAVFNSRLFHFAAKNPYLFAITFLTVLTIALLCVFFPPAAGVFLAFLSHDALLALAAFSPMIKMSLVFLSIYIASAVAKVVSQLFEAVTNLLVDLWFIITDEKSFIAKHPFLSIISFVLLTSVFLAGFFLLVSASPLVTALSVIALVDLAAIISCKICHAVDFLRTYMRERHPVTDASVESERDIQNARMEQRRKIAEVRKSKAAEVLRQQQVQEQQQEQQQELEIIVAPVSSQQITPPAVNNIFDELDAQMQSNILALEASDDPDDNFNPSDTFMSLFSARPRIFTNTLTSFLTSLIQSDSQNNNGTQMEPLSTRTRDRTLTRGVNEIVNNLNNSLQATASVQNVTSNNNNNNVNAVDTNPQVNALMNIALNSDIFTTSTSQAPDWRKSSSSNHSNDSNNEDKEEDTKDKKLEL